MNVEMVERLKSILDTVRSVPEAEEFMQPVDWHGLGLLDYPEVVEHPMDLSTIQTKLTSGNYRSPKEFWDDINLTWRNCRTYNHKKSRIYRTAVTIQKFSDALHTEFEMKYKMEDTTDYDETVKLAYRISLLRPEGISQVVRYLDSHDKRGVVMRSPSENVCVTLALDRLKTNTRFELQYLVKLLLLQDHGTSSAVPA
eukprot:Lankesteria_metandrocarpae@DN1859_c0_g1_i1.p1